MTAALFVGLATLYITYAVHHYPGEDTKSLALEEFLGAGGPAANAAVACAIVQPSPAAVASRCGFHFSHYAVDERGPLGLVSQGSLRP